MEATLQILNDEGMHARPAGILVKKAALFNSKIEIKAHGQTKSAKSIMGIMSLGLQKNDQIIISAEGPDEAEALQALTALVNNRFEDA